MRFLLLAAVCLAVPPSAQTSLRLVDPILSVDGRHVASAGASLVQDSFGVLSIAVPGQGVYTVSERPFAGARRAGQFDGRGLYFASQGRSVRLVSREPLLSLDGPVSAYVAFTPISAPARGPARFAVADSVDGRDRQSVQPYFPTPSASGGPRLELDDRPDARDIAHLNDSEVRRLRSELVRVREDLANAVAACNRALAARDAALAQRDALLAERDLLTRQLGQARARPGAVPTSAPISTSPPAPVAIRTRPVGQDRAVAFLPGFDFARIQNPDVIRRSLEMAAYPRWATVGRIEGDVLVLLQTDRTGRVVRTAVPAPMGGGLDGLAEEIVREMRFHPSSEGQRSQVVVHFDL